MNDYIIALCCSDGLTVIHAAADSAVQAIAQSVSRELAARSRIASIVGKRFNH